MRGKINSRIIVAIILTMVMAFVFVGCGDKDAGDAVKDTGAKADADEKAARADADRPLTALFVASDYQVETGWATPKETLAGILCAAKADGKKIDEVIICGDYTNDSVRMNYNMSPDDSINEIKGVVETEYPKLTEDNMLFAQGNHDLYTDSLAESGLHEFDDYLVYVLNTERDYPWKQGKTAGAMKKVENTAASMKTCFDKLVDRGEKRPVIIAGHVPMHFSGRTSSLHTTGDNLYSSLIFDVVNRAGKSLDIVYFFGHNHNKGWDCYMGQSCVYKAAGDSILIPKFDDSDTSTNEYTAEKLNFTYLNAGYLGYSMNCSSTEAEAGTADQYKGADDTLTGTVCEIYKDRIVLTRYSVDGVHQMGSAGCTNPYRDDSTLIPEENYGRLVDSPVEVER